MSTFIVEHLKEIQEKLKEQLSHFYNFDKKKISLSMTLLGKEEILDRNFKSKEQVLLEEKERIKEEKRQSLSCDPIVKKVEEVFHTKLDKIILNDF